MIEICCLDERLRVSWYIYIHARCGKLVIQYDYNIRIGVGTHDDVGHDMRK